MSRRVSALAWVVVAAAALLPTAAQAQSQVSEAAENAVRRAVRSRLGNNYRVAFENPTERFLSLTEVVVSGKGHISRGDAWDFEDSLDYSIKVKLDLSGTRDLQMTFGSGDRHRSGSSWEPVEEHRNFVRLSHPKWYERFDTSRVLFEGTAGEAVTISVFDKKNNKVAERSAGISGGKFSTTLDLPEGQLRAFVQARGSSETDEVRFSVIDNGHGWGLPAPSLRIDEPGRGAVVRGPRVRFAGTTSDPSPRVSIWDARNSRVFDRTLSRVDGKWSTDVNLDPGEYRMTVDAGGARETRNFQVWGDRHPHDEGRAYLRVQEPSEGAVRKDARITVSGTSSARSVRVLLTDERNNRVDDRSVSTRGNYWSTQFALGDGSYRLTVTDDDARLREMRSFRVERNAHVGGGLLITLRVTEPRRDGVAKGPRVTVAGNSSERSVRVQVWDDRGTRVVDRNVPTRDDYFNTQIPLANGRYRVRVDGASGRDYEELWFNVK